MVFKIIITICVLLPAVAVVALIVRHFENKLLRERSKISIQSSMDLVQLPIITFYNENTKLNFVLDSGSTQSHISQESSKLLKGNFIDTEYSFNTASGSNNASIMVETILKYKEEEFNVELIINDGLDEAFQNIKEENGVQVHGILGSDFLKKYKYIMDFAELTVYHK